MKNIEYSDIFKKAFLMTWSNKFMWFFGFFIFLGSISTTFNNSKSSQNPYLQPLQTFSQNYPLLSVSLAFLIVLIIAGFYLLKIVSTAALIKISNNITVYKQTKIKTIFTESKEYIWRMLAMEILIGVITFLLVAIVIIPIAYLFSLNSKFLSFIFLVFGFFIVLMLLILAFYILKYGQIFLVLGNSSIKNALESAYELLEKNIKQSVIFGMISVALSFLFFILLIFSILAIASLFSLIGFVLYLFFVKSGIMISMLIIMGSALIILTLILFSWFNAFMQSAWVLFFQLISLDKKEDTKEKEVEIESSGIIADPEAV